MLTKEERAAIMARYNNGLHIFRVDIRALLDALDEMEAENARWNDADCNTCLIASWLACDEICHSKSALIRALAAMNREANRWEFISRTMTRYAEMAFAHDLVESTSLEEVMAELGFKPDDQEPEAEAALSKLENEE